MKTKKSPEERVSNRVKLTTDSVKAAIDSAPQGKRTRVWDTDVRPFYLQITKSGYASYCYRYPRPGRSPGEIVIGGVHEVSADAARKKAHKSLADVTLNGIDPGEQKVTAARKGRERDRLTIQALVDEFIASPEWTQTKESTQNGRLYNLNTYILPIIGKKRYAEYSRREAKAFILSIQEELAKKPRDPNSRHRFTGGMSTANACHKTMKRVYNWAIDEEITDKNPFGFDKLHDDTPEKRVGAIDDSRFKILWEGLESLSERPDSRLSGLGVKLHYLTLQRPSEIIKSKRTHFELENKVWTIPDPKQNRKGKKKRTFVIPLTEYAVDLVRRALESHDGEYLIPGRYGGASAGNRLSQRFSNVRDKLVKAGKLPTDNIVLYDGRRFGRTLMTKRLGISKDIAEKVINHASGRAIDDLYDVADYSPEVRAAHEAWHAEIRRIVGE